MRFRALIFAVVLSLLAGGAGAKRSFAQSATGEPGWTKVQTEHFEIFSNASEARVGDLGEELETYWELLDPPDGPSRVQVLFFGDITTFLPFQVASQSPAFFQVGRGRERIVAYDAGEDLGLVLRHELFHLGVHREGVHLPPWMEEGLAELYSTIRRDPKSLCVMIGAPIRRHLRVLASSSSAQFSVKRLFEVSSEDLDRMSQADRQHFYARSWLLVHFVSDVGDSDERKSTFVDLLENQTAEEALWSALQMTPGELDDRLATYTPPEEEIKLSYSHPAPPPPPPPPGTVLMPEPPPLLSEQPVVDASRELLEKSSFERVVFSPQPWEVPLLQADVLGMLGKQEVAANMYAHLAAEFPDVPEIRESQGMLALERRDMEAAQRHFEEAVERSSQSGPVYFQLATLRCGMQSEEAACLEWIDRALSHDDVGREAQLYAIDFALNVRDFPRALRYLEEATPESDEDKVQMLQKIAYAQYQLEQFDEARKAIADAESFEESRRHAKPISDLKRAIAQREQFVVQKRLFEGSPDDPTLQEALRKAFASFEREPNAKLEAGRLREVVCGEGRLALLADTPSGRLRLDIENPMDLTILTGNRRHRELELTCGPQSATIAQFGYLLTGEGAETRGLLRILRFDGPEASAPRSR